MASTVQALKCHIDEYHRRPVGGTAGLNLAELRRHHKDQHRHQECDHSHGGPEVGLMARRPAGWDTGADMIPEHPGAEATDG